MDYFALHRLSHEGSAQHQEYALSLLAWSMNRRNVLAFVGAGLSRPFGLPHWEKFAADALERTLKKAGIDRDDRRRLERFRDIVTPREGLDESPSQFIQAGSDDLMFFLGACKKAIGGDEWVKLLRAYFVEDPCWCFSSRTEEWGTPVGFTDATFPNPYKALLDLPVRRFATTNYDCLLEHALVQWREVRLEEFGIGSKVPGDRRPRSFTQEAEYLDELALFSITGVNVPRHRVFHCHGRIDRPGSVIGGAAPKKPVSF